VLFISYDTKEIESIANIKLQTPAEYGLEGLGRISCLDSHAVGGSHEVSVILLGLIFSGG